MSCSLCCRVVDRFARWSMSVSEVSTRASDLQPSDARAGDALAGLRSVLDGLFALDPSVWCDGESLVGLVGTVSRGVVWIRRAWCSVSGLE